MKTTVDLPDKLLRQIKLRAVRQGQKLKDAIAELLRRGLAAGTEQPAARPVIKTDPKTGFPYVEGSTAAPAQQMTIAEVLALEQQAQLDEDLERLGVSR
jgi:hypothetical protein